MAFRIRFIIFLFVAQCTFFSSGFPAFAFTDIQGHWAEQQISDWAKRGFVKGYSNGKFDPDCTITRAEFITLVNNSFGYYKKASITYKDVSPTEWFYSEVAKANAAGYIKGYEDNTLRPHHAIERQEIAAIIFRLLGLKTSSDLQTLCRFKDAGKISGWAKQSVCEVTNKNLMKGYPEQTFGPLNLATRAEALVSLDNIFWYRNPVIITNVQ